MDFNFLSSLGFVGQSDEAFAKSINGYVNSLTGLTTTLYNTIQVVIEYYSSNPDEPMSEQSILDTLSSEYQSLTGKTLDYDTVTSIDNHLFTIQEFATSLYAYGLSIHNGTDDDVDVSVHHLNEDGTVNSSQLDFLSLCDSLTDNIAANSVLFEGIKAAVVHPNDNTSAVNAFMNSVSSKLMAIDGRSTPYIDFISDALVSSNAGIKLKVVQLIGSFTEPVNRTSEEPVPVTDIWKTNALYEVNTHSPVVAWGLEAERVIKEADWAALGDALLSAFEVPLKIFAGIGEAVCKVGEWLFSGITKTIQNLSDQLDLVPTDNASGDGTVSGFATHVVVSESGWTNAAAELSSDTGLTFSTGPTLFAQLDYNQIYRCDLCGGVNYYIKERAKNAAEGDLLHCFSFTRPISLGEVEGSSNLPIVDFFINVGTASDDELLALISQIPSALPSSWEWDSEAISYLAAGKTIAFLMAHSYMHKKAMFDGLAGGISLIVTNANRTLEIITGGKEQYGIGATIQVLCCLGQQFNDFFAFEAGQGYTYNVYSSKITAENRSNAAALLSYFGPIIRKDDNTVFVPYDKTSGVSVGSYHLKSTQETATSFNNSLIGTVITAATVVLAIKFGPSALKGLKKMLKTVNIYRASTAYTANRLASAVASGNQVDIDQAYAAYKKVKRVNKLLGVTSYGVGALTARGIDAAVNAVGPETTTTLSTDALGTMITSVHRSITG